MQDRQHRAAARNAWRLVLLGAVVVLGLLCGLQTKQVAAQVTFTPRDEAPEDFPPGPGRDDTFYACTACHGFKLIAQQGMNRRQWDDSLNWMTEKHTMPKLEGKERETVLNYLEATFPPRAPSTGGGFQNPFLNR